MTRLTKWTHPKSGEVRRVYVEREGLKVKLWLEPAHSTSSACEVHFYGNETEFGRPTVDGEPLKLTVARQALADVGLDLTHCTWSDIVAKSQ